jgi:hypothetical protein
MTSPSKRAQPQPTSTTGCNTATGASVAQLPEPVPELEHSNRSRHVHYEPGQHTACHGGDPNNEVLRPGAATEQTRLYQAKRVEVRGIEPLASTVRLMMSRTTANRDDP